MAASKVGAKKSLFKKPAWASASTKSTDDDDDPIFGQAHLYQEIVQKEKERRERHSAKQKERAEKAKQEQEQREFKRRRISKEAEDSDYGSDSDAKSQRSESAASQRCQADDVPAHHGLSRELRDTPRKRKTKLVDQLDLAKSPQTRSQKARGNTQDGIIVVSEQEDDESPSLQEDDTSGTPQSEIRARQVTKQTDPESESEEEDEYLRELKAKARREARSNRPTTDTEKEVTPGSPAVQFSADSHSPTGFDPTSPSSKRGNRATSNPAVEDEPEVKIWIKTIIPNAKEVIVNRKIGQPLDKVKDFWIKRNNLEPALADKIFFTWNGTRLYNSTTMRGIIERLKKTHPTRDGTDPSNGHITIEAVTDEIFEYRQKQRERRLAEANAADDQADSEATQHGDDGTGNDDTPEPQAQKAGIVIKLRAQGHEEMSLRVRPHTTMRKILAGFCTVKRIDSDMQKWLSYDGDKLDEGATVEDVGFEHEDTVDVYLR